MQKGFAGVIVLIGILILGLGITGAWYTKIIQIPNFPPPGCSYKQVQCIQAPCNPILVCDSTQSPTPPPVQNTPSPTPIVSPVPVASDETAQCVKEKQEKLGQTEYVKGYLLVGFKTDIKEAAGAIIKSYGLEVESYESEKIKPLTLYVKVQVGEEFKWICKLEQDSNIEAVGLNFIIKAL